MQIYNHGMADKHEKRQTANRTYITSNNPVPGISSVSKNHIADMITRKAQEHGVPIRKNPSVAERLTAVPSGINIPQDMCEVVAEILAQIISLDMKE